ncbi:MAG: PspC domain-containing protein [Cytophagales bacterium]|nr:PspC domain-containing protein [Cytophagales bacterium]
MEKIITLFEHKIFGVCSYLGDFLGVSSGKIRLFFIYASFLTKGSPVIIYLALAFVIDLKKYFRLRKSRIWDF